MYLNGCNTPQPPAQIRTQKSYRKSGPNRTEFCSAQFAEHCSGVKRDEREDGNDVNVEPRGEGERESELAPLLQHHSGRCSEETSSNSLS